MKFVFGMLVSMAAVTHAASCPLLLRGIVEPVKQIYLEHPERMQVVKLPGKTRHVIVLEMNDPASISISSKTLVPVNSEDERMFHEVSEVRSKDERNQAARHVIGEFSKTLAVGVLAMVIGHVTVVLKESSVSLSDHLFYIGVETLVAVGTTVVHYLFSVADRKANGRNEKYKSAQRRLLHQAVSTIRAELADEGASPSIVILPGELFLPTLDILFNSDRAEFLLPN